MCWCDVNRDEQEGTIEAGAVLDSKEASLKAGDGCVIIWALNDFKKGRRKKVSGCSVWGVMVEDL